MKQSENKEHLKLEKVNKGNESLPKLSDSYFKVKFDKYYLETLKNTIEFTKFWTR